MRTIDTDGMSEDDLAPRAVVLTVRGHPRPQPRARVMGKGRGVAATAGKLAAAWRTRVTEAARQTVEAAGGPWAVQQRLGMGSLAGRPGEDGAPVPMRPLELVLEVRLPTEASGRWGRWHTQRPDGDNLAKLVLDALADAGLLPGDDCAVAVTRVAKRWSSPEDAGITARLAVLEEPGAAAPAEWVREFEPGWLRG